MYSLDGQKNSLRCSSECVNGRHLQRRIWSKQYGFYADTTVADQVGHMYRTKRSVRDTNQIQQARIYCGKVQWKRQLLDRLLFGNGIGYATKRREHRHNIEYPASAINNANVCCGQDALSSNLMGRQMGNVNIGKIVDSMLSNPLSMCCRFHASQPST